jgi:hypothetical protein
MESIGNRTLSRFDWIAPEHFHIARTMERVHGEFVITPHPIFQYSRENPPKHLVEAIRLARKLKLGA